MIQGERTLAGRYEIGRRVGRGGMAEVYLGTDERLGRKVAVKLLSTSLAGEPDFRSRFRAEAQAAARMTHPTIVRVFDAGEDTFVRADGHELIVPYIVMEYIDGDQLRDIMMDAPLELDRVTSYMSGILTALEYSHRAGVVHRDIKPGNIKVTPEGTVKVMDFGIARAISDTAGTIAQTTAILGTASYFSPEQAKGEQVDGRSDLYSAGIVLYEMLTGRVPFQGDSAVAVAYQHVTEKPVPPSKLNPDVTPAMDAVVLRALAKNREARFQSASEFRRDLELAAQGTMPAFAVADDPNDDTQLFGAAPTAIDQTESAFASLSETDDRAPQVQRRPPAMWIWGAAALVVVIVIAVVIWVGNLNNADPLPPTTAEIPDVVGQTWESAETQFTAVGLTPTRETETSETVPDGTVIRTAPAAGQVVPLTQAIVVTVSTGPSALAMPDVKGMTVEQATVAITGAGLTVGEVTRKDDPNVLADTIIDTDPPIGSQVSPETPINLVVSTGLVTLPDLRELTLGEAERTLADLGLNPVRNPDANCPANDVVEADGVTPIAESQTVTRMDVPAGSVAQHSTVGLTYCLGVPTPTPEPTPTNT